MGLFKRRQQSGPEHEQAIADLARHGGVSMDEARKSAEGMSAEQIAEFIELERQAAAEADPPQ